ncbi:hypothetical protein [Anaerotardibacter muris]|uniref:hypothetical protein n=1 Tax=Anaerotardibacter muris TaxID=2941505 RepID=UPI00203C00F4|nr:hypothetical protein [Anaerotardibacter muris]
MQPTKKQTTKILVGVIVALAVVLVALVVALVATPQETLTSHSAQAEVEAEEKALEEAEKEGYYDTDPIEVVQLTELIGCNLDQALERIGHGAEIDGESKLVAGGLTEVTVLLGEESATLDTGAALTYLYLDRSGRIVQASYRININDLSCASLPFDQIVNDADLIGRLLVGAGLSTYEPNPITAPAREKYALYDSSGKTTTEERYQFMGTGSDEAGTPFEWSVFLDYDYTQAIESNNLADTVRTVHVSINSVDS